jgi:hypothetical protein
MSKSPTTAEALDCNACRWADFDAGEPGDGAVCWFGHTNKPMPLVRCEHYDRWRANGE